MTMQDIYPWVQMGLQVLIGGGVVAGIYRYFGVLKRLIEGQEKTIAAQAEQMKAQSTVLQDFERLNKVMQQVIDTVDAPAMLERWQKYKALVDVQAEQLAQQLRQQADEITARLAQQLREQARETANQTVAQFMDRVTEHAAKTMTGLARVAADAMRFIPPDQRMALIDAADLAPRYKELLRIMADAAPYLPTDTLLSTSRPARQVRLADLVKPPSWAEPKAP
jgi:hypothetical protein